MRVFAFVILAACANSTHFDDAGADASPPSDATTSDVADVVDASKPEADALPASPFAHYATVTFTTPPPSTLTAFPVLLAFSDATLKSKSNGGTVVSTSGFDVVFGTNATCSAT